MTEREKARAGNSKSNELILALKEADDFTRAKIIEKLVSSPDKAMVQQVVATFSSRRTLPCEWMHWTFSRKQGTAQ